MVDIQDVPRDAALAGLGVATDGEAMRQLLAPHFGSGLQLLQVKVGRFTYKPGRNARLAYRVKLLDTERQVALRHVMHGRMERPDDAAHLYKKMHKRSWIQPAYGPPLLYFADLGLVLWGFPNDPKLPGVDIIAGPEGLGAVAERIPALAARGIQHAEGALVKYVPGKRLVMRHKITATDGSRRLVYTKTYAHSRGGAIYTVMRRLWESARDDANTLACPEPLAYLEDLQTLVLGALPGTAALAELHGDRAQAAMEQAGRGLARIHAGAVQGLEPWGEAHELANFMKAAGVLQRYDAELAPGIERVRALAQAQLASIETAPPTPIHGAFRFTQLLAFRGRLALVDFDGFRDGHPMCDAGSFIAHLYYLCAKGEMGEDETRAAARAFIDGYTAVHSGPLPEAALRWYAAVILVAKHAQKCVKRMKDDGDIKIQRLVERAEGWLDGSDTPV